MSELHSALRENVRMLGEMLGQNVAEHLGTDFLDKIEAIRHAAKADRSIKGGATNPELVDMLTKLDKEEMVSVARAFNQFLNLANIAEQYHLVRRHRDELEEGVESFDALLERLKQQNVNETSIVELLDNMNIEFVLTAHPTEVTRRTLIRKYESIAECLARLDQADLSDKETEKIKLDLNRLVCEAWHTNEIREERPTAVDEARWGFAVVENSFWHAIPDFLRDLDKALFDKCGINLPVEASPIRIASWMGGDRDGNPNVTSVLTEEVLALSRWMAADLYLRDVRALLDQLSMWECSDALRAKADEYLKSNPRNQNEPYRAVLSELRQRLLNTREWAAQQAKNLNNSETSTYRGEELLLDNAALIEPLKLCYDSLIANGLKTVANGLLLDTIRRASCFGLELVKLDIRQDSERHMDVMSEITQYLGLGDFEQWSEDERQTFLLRELKSKRPLFPDNWPCSSEVKEVLDTCKVIAAQPQDALGAYVISMASKPSDVLTVILLLKEMGISHPMRVVPLFETLADLSQASESIDNLLSVEWYKEYTKGKQEVMIGYSDSAKDAGQMAAAWAQYQAQESLVNVAEKHEVRLTLFHGRGGTVGRGGGPANRAIMSQPPGSVNGTFRITEQGEMIRFKFGQPAVAKQSLKLYLNAVVEASLLPPTAPKATWRELMDSMTTTSLSSYRQVVRENTDFVEYFRAATPEQELGKLALGSRPARRKMTGGVESLRAIPWIFAWTQIRLMLPAWLGSDEALKSALESSSAETLNEMLDSWPFFKTHIDMLEMVVAKGDVRIAGYYDQILAPEGLKPLGQELRQRFELIAELVNQVKQQDHLLASSARVEQSLQVRAPYTDPLHYLQAELLRRDRLCPDDIIEVALKVTMAGIAAGIRNTG